MVRLIREILKRLVKGEISIEEAEKLLKIAAIEEIETIAKLDVKRHMRTGVPEVILAEGKDSEDLAKIVMKALERSGRAIISRIENKHVEAIKKIIPSSTSVQINKKARMIVIKKEGFTIEKTGGKVGIITAGTSDIPIAEEARIIAEEMGCEVITAYDVGVAGIHRLFPSLKEMIEKDVDALIVVAGREGALPSVVAGMVDIPVIGVPTSIGYGLGEKGISALTAMLQACSLGLAVVNIDSGVAAGAIAALIANRAAKTRKNKKQ